MEKVHWGIIGAGGIAKRRIIPAIKNEKNSIITGIMNRSNPGKIAKEFGVSFYTSDLDEILSREDIDAVYIATPVYLHKEEVIKAAERGKHILCEKPLALTYNDAKAMLDAVKLNGVKFQVGFMMHYHGAHREINRIIKEKKIGTPVYARAQLTCWYPPLKNAWRQNPELGGGGALIDMAPHLYDLLEMFFGPVKRILSLTGRVVQAYQVEDSATTLIEFVSGVHATVDTFFNIPDEAARTRLEIYGSKGAILTEGTLGQDPGGKAEIYEKATDTGYEPMQNKDIENVFKRLPYKQVDIFLAEVKAFVNALIEKREITENTGTDGVHSMKLIDAAYRSAKTGCFIDI